MIVVVVVVVAEGDVEEEEEEEEKMKKKIFSLFRPLKKRPQPGKRMLLANSIDDENDEKLGNTSTIANRTSIVNRSTNNIAIDNVNNQMNIRAKPEILEPLNIDAIINNAIAKAANTESTRRTDIHTMMINRKLTMARKENPHSIRCIGMPPIHENFVFTYTGLRIQPDGTISPVTFDDGYVLQTILNLPLSVRRSSLGYRPKYREIMFHGFYEHKFFLYYQQFTEDDHYRFEHLEPHEKRSLSFPRNRYSDLFDMLIYGDILIVDENCILQPNHLAECWKQRRF
jgi:hypothetical protein